MGLWEKFKSSVGGEVTDTAQKVDSARFYEGASTELKPKANVENIAIVTDDSSATENYEMAMNYYRVSHDEYKQDLPKAIRLFEKAAVCNHPEAIIYLAEMFLSGMGCTRDSVKGLEYLHKAENLSEDKALKLLAVQYSYSNIDRALKYYEKYFETDDFKKYFKYEDDEYKDDGLIEFYELLVKNKKPIANKFIDKYKKTIIGRYTLSYDN
jgi:TPR repeat protein